MARLVALRLLLPGAGLALLIGIGGLWAHLRARAYRGYALSQTIDGGCAFTSTCANDPDIVASRHYEALAGILIVLAGAVAITAVVLSVLGRLRAR